MKELFRMLRNDPKETIFEISSDGRYWWPIISQHDKNEHLFKMKMREKEQCKAKEQHNEGKEMKMCFKFCINFVKLLYKFCKNFI